MSKKFWKIQNAVDSDGSELILEGVVASESWWGDEVTPQMFRDELKALNTSNLTVVINSPGGDVFAGVQIYNALKNLNQHVTVRVDGLAASIASVIAMAGDKIVLSPGSLMMVHKPSMMTWGDANDMDKAKEVLNVIEAELLDIYVSRTGLSLERVSELVNAETWMGGAEAVELGFADEAKTEKEETSISDTVKAMMGGKLQFSMKATQHSLDAFAKKVNMEEVKTEEPTEPIVEKTDETVEVPTPIVEPVTEPTVEPTVEPEVVAEPAKEAETKITNQLKETPKMENETAVAVENIVVKPSQELAPVVSNYLETPQAMEDFAKHLEAHAGEEARDVMASWKETTITNGVTNPGVLLPTPLIQEIDDAFKAGGEIFNLVDWTGLDSYNTAWDTVVGEDSRGAGYNRSVAETKREEVITLGNRIIRPQFVYKYITLNKEDVKAQRGTGALVRYVLSELPKRVIREIERAIVIGDGRAPGSAYKINESSNGGFFSIKTDAASGTSLLALAYNPAVGESVYEALVRAQALIEADGSMHLIAKKGFVTEVRLLQNVNGQYVFAPGTDVGSAMGFSSVITPDWLTDANDAFNDAYILVAGAYKGVGDRGVEAFQNFVLSTNKNEYLQEIWAGGGLAKIASAVAIGFVNS